MQIFKIIFGLIIFGQGLFVFCNILLGGTFPFAGLLLFYAVLFLQLPVFIIFVFVILYCCLYKKTPVSFFKIELIYLLINMVWISYYHFLTYYALIVRDKQNGSSNITLMANNYIISIKPLLAVK